MAYRSHEDFERLAAEMGAGLSVASGMKRLAALGSGVAMDMESLRTADFFLGRELGLDHGGEIFANLPRVAARGKLDALSRLKVLPAMTSIHEHLAAGLGRAGRWVAAEREARRALALNPLDEALKRRLAGIDGGDGPISLACRDYRFSYRGYEEGLPGPQPWETIRFGDRLVLTDLQLMTLFSRPLEGGAWEQSETRFSYPFGLHDDGEGCLWACDLWAHRLVKLDASLAKTGEHNMRKLLKGRFDNPWPFLVCRSGKHVFVGVQNAKQWRFSLVSFNLDDPAGSVRVFDDDHFGFIYRMTQHQGLLYIVRLDQRDFSRVPGEVVTRWKPRPDGSLEFAGSDAFPAPVQQVLPVENGFFIKTFSSIIRTDASMSTLYSISLPVNQDGANLSEVGFLCAPQGPEGGVLLFLDYLHSRLDTFAI